MTCDRCQRYEKLKTQAPELKPIKVNKALELVGMDLIGNACKDYLLIRLFLQILVYSSNHIYLVFH